MTYWRVGFESNNLIKSCWILAVCLVQNGILIKLLSSCEWKVFYFPREPEQAFSIKILNTDDFEQLIS